MNTAASTFNPLSTDAPHGPHVIIQYATKPWDRGRTFTRFIEVPGRIGQEAVTRWLKEKRLLKPDETLLSFHLEAGA
jgi:hypothetical protein